MGTSRPAAKLCRDSEQSLPSEFTDCDIQQFDILPYLAAFSDR
jgi:hypothetical protein